MRHIFKKKNNAPKPILTRTDKVVFHLIEFAILFLVLFVGIRILAIINAHHGNDSGGFLYDFISKQLDLINEENVSEIASIVVPSLY